MNSWILDFYTCSPEDNQGGVTLGEEIEVKEVGKFLSNYPKAKL